MGRAVNNLPAHRRVINGRTWSRAWAPTDFDPWVYVPRKLPLLEIALGYGLAIATAVGLGWWLVEWWTS